MTKQTTPGFARRYWTRALWIAALVACLAQTAMLSREVQRGLDRLSTAPIDDVRWTLSQTEVELLRMLLAVKEVSTPGARASVDGLREARRRFDIFYSRVNTLATSDRFGRFRQSETVQEALGHVRGFLDRTVPAMDGTDEVLRDSLPRIAEEAEALIPDVRQLTLAGIPVFAQSADQRRMDIMSTLQQLALTALALVVLLVAFLVILWRLQRKATALASEHETMRNRFEAAIASSLDAVFVTDTRGRILEFNGGAERIFGFARDEVLGREIVDLTIPPERREEHLRRLAHYRETGQTEVVGKGRHRLDLMRKSGEVFPAEIAVSAAFSDRQEVFVAFARDITIEQAAEQELRDARDSARAGEEAKTKLLTVMSHEMRTPLNGILGSLDLMDRANLTDRQNRLLGAIRVSGELLLSHVNKVLELSRLDSEHSQSRTEDFDLSALVESVADSLRPTAQDRSNEVTTTFLQGAAGPVCGDKRALQQCLVNLIGNAIKFTRDGEISVEVERMGDAVEFRVADTGLGIPDDQLERIFDEFVTIDTDYARENPGTGLGLPITRKLVTTMGGTIEVDSLEDEGSLFTIRLPLPVAASAPSDADPQARTACKVTPKHVLIVEDNAVNRMILEHMLDELGCTHESADNGDAGIALAAKGEFDLLLLDISMPGKDGLQTLAGIRALDSQPASARAITAHAGREDRERILAVFDDILIKPINLARLTEKLAPTAVPEPEGDVAQDFIARFGRDAFDGHVADLRSEMDGMLDRLADAPALTENDRQQAHKMAGTAAVLGQAPLRQALQRLETLPDARWQGDGPALLAELGREIRRISAAQAA
ncbi:PAS domain-containing hybrid sensor histidine kinase/response regulator [Paracoccus sp. PARArs4]|uniref:hybrid sensor histidine kinase/response regulator n=1 Tax=Paracoccus sp. PARArs4 TaxID=2853442 RepID=UPI0024A7669D|nr:PAS domain-containing hybrid sensor histidine kinase/response regulator [Paracoccus sp. PARArs4]